MTRASVQQRRWNLDGSHAEGSLISHRRGLICPVITRGDTQPSSILTTSKTWRLNYYSVDCAVVDAWWFIHQRHNQLLGTWDVGILQPFCRSPSGTKKKLNLRQIEPCSTFWPQCNVIWQDTLPMNPCKPTFPVNVFVMRAPCFCLPQNRCK